MKPNTIIVNSVTRVLTANIVFLISLPPFMGSLGMTPETSRLTPEKSIDLNFPYECK